MIERIKKASLAAVVALPFLAGASKEFATKNQEPSEIEFTETETPIVYGYAQMCEKLQNDLKKFEEAQAYKLFCEANKDMLSQPFFNDAKNLEILKYVNDDINMGLKIITDFEKHGKEDVWEGTIVTSGDCEEFVMMKYRDLVLNYKISPENLFFGLVKARNLKGDLEGHLILLVRTIDKQTKKIDFYVLDVYDKEVKKIEERKDLTFIKYLNMKNKIWYDFKIK